MPSNYEECYEKLKIAQEGFLSIREKPTRETKYAALRPAFYQLYQACNIAARCYEVANYAGASAQGGMYTQTRDELIEFLEASRHCHMILDAGDDDKIEEILNQWLTRAKAYVERTRASEAAATNIQFARIPEEQPVHLITKTGKAWKKGL